MNRLKIFFIISLMVQIAFGGDISRKGTTGAEELLLPVGARSIATSGAFLASTIGTEAIYYNPAGLAGTPFTEAMFSYTSYFLDINISYLAVGMKIGDLGSFGLSVKSLDFGDIPVTTYSSPDGTGANYSPAYTVFGLTYAKEVTDRVRAGVTAKLIHEGIMSTSADGMAFDFGVQYKFLSNIWLGVAIKNLGGDMSFGGQDLESKTIVRDASQNSSYNNGLFTPVIEPFQLPSYFEISTAYEMKMEDVNILLATTFHNYSSYEDALDFGAEVQILDIFFIRYGYNYLLAQSGYNQYGASYGAGVEYGTEGIKVCVDYAYRTAEDFSGNNILTLKLKF
jgi:hypothetical protein